MKSAFDADAKEEFGANLLHALPFFVASLLVGVIAVGYSKLFGYAEALLQKAMHWNAWSIFVLSPMCFIIAWLLVKHFAPNAKGSGIPQVMAALDIAGARNEDKVSTLLSIRIAITKIVSSFFMVLGGGAIGREGPTIQIAASIFRFVRRLVPASWPRLSEKSFILTGAAAGLAAAFNTPLGGVVFAIEELARIHINYFKTALFTAVILAGLTAQLLLGPYLYLGYPNVKNLSLTIFPVLIGIAIIAGILGSAMCKGIVRIVKWKSKLSTPQLIMFILAVSLFMAGVAFAINESVLGSGKELMTHVLFTDDKHVPWHIVLLRIMGPALCFNVGGAGGVFAPALAAGASLGASMASLFGFIGANANILILGGMVGFLTGVTRTPFTSAILVLEMTNGHNVIFHLMVAGMVSSLAAMLVDKHTFYEHMKQRYIDELKPAA